MKADRGAGLVMAGGVNHSFVSRMPVLLRDLGPVKGASLRVARRIVNTMRAGFAVADYAALEPCGLIWLAVPDAMLDKVAKDLAAQTPLGDPLAEGGAVEDAQHVAG